MELSLQLVACTEAAALGSAQPAPERMSFGGFRCVCSAAHSSTLQILNFQVLQFQTLHFQTLHFQTFNFSKCFKMISFLIF